VEILPPVLGIIFDPLATVVEVEIKNFRLQYCGVVVEMICLTRQTPSRPVIVALVVHSLHLEVVMPKQQNPKMISSRDLRQPFPK
jgi:hypothetical protein